jgi:hypothetical protein
MFGWWPWKRSRESKSEVPPVVERDPHWTRLPPIQRVLGDTPTVIRTDEFASSLATAQDPSLVAAQEPWFTDRSGELPVLRGLFESAEKPHTPPPAVDHAPRRWQHVPRTVQRMRWADTPSADTEAPAPDALEAEADWQTPAELSTDACDVVELVRPTAPTTRPLTDADPRDQYRMVEAVEGPASLTPSTELLDDDQHVDSPPPISDQTGIDARHPARREPKRHNPAQPHTISAQRVESFEPSLPPIPARVRHDEMAEPRPVTPLPDMTAPTHRTVHEDPGVGDHAAIAHADAKPTSNEIGEKPAPPMSSATSSTPIQRSTALQSFAVEPTASHAIEAPGGGRSPASASADATPLGAAQPSALAPATTFVPTARADTVQRSHLPVVAPTGNRELGTASSDEPGTPSLRHLATTQFKPPSRIVLLPPLTSGNRHDTEFAGSSPPSESQSDFCGGQSVVVFNSPPPMSLQRIFERAVRTSNPPDLADNQVVHHESGSTTVTFGSVTAQPDIDSGSPTVAQAVAEPAPSVVQESAPVSPPQTEPAAPAPEDPTELVNRIYDTLAARLRSELWLDRERAGVLLDVQR